MIAYIRTMAVNKKCWLDRDTFADGVALAQMIPGATAMQVAAYVGLKTRGLPGAVTGYVGFGLPGVLLMMVLAELYSGSRNLPIVVSAFGGLQAIIVAIITNAASAFGKTTVKDWRTAAIAAVAAILFGLNVNPILVILLAALGGLVLLKPKKVDPGHPAFSARSRTHTRPLLYILSVFIVGLVSIYFLDRLLFELTLLMFRIDLFAFGGGFASLPLMLHEIVTTRQWMDSQTFMNGIVLGQITPGPIVITATFVGYLLGGLPGGIAATVGIFLPSFVVLAAVSPYFDRLRTSPYFNKAIRGVLCSFVGLLLTVTIRFALNVHWDLFHSALAAAALCALLLKADILWVVVVGTAASVLLPF
jgi:chromate transporter